MLLGRPQEPSAAPNAFFPALKEPTDAHDVGFGRPKSKKHRIAPFCYGASGLKSAILLRSLGAQKHHFVTEPRGSKAPFCYGASGLKSAILLRSLGAQKHHFVTEPRGSKVPFCYGASGLKSTILLRSLGAQKRSFVTELRGSKAPCCYWIWGAGRPWACSLGVGGWLGVNVLQIGNGCFSV